MTGKRGKETYQSRPRRNINLDKVGPSIPAHISSEEARLLDIAPKTPKGGIIGIKHNTISTSNINANAIIRKALRGMEIENPQQTRPLKDKNLISLVLQTDVRLRRSAASRISARSAACRGRTR